MKYFNIIVLWIIILSANSLHIILHPNSEIYITTMSFLHLFIGIDFTKIIWNEAKLKKEYDKLFFNGFLIK